MAKVNTPNSFSYSQTQMAALDESINELNGAKEQAEIMAATGDEDFKEQLDKINLALRQAESLKKAFGP